MIEKEIQDGIIGEGPLQAEIKIKPVERLKLRPNVIFDIVYNQKVLHLGCTDHLSLIDDKVKSGTYFHQQLSRVSSECLGIDINRASIEHLYNLGIKNIIERDITQPGISQITNEVWDYLLMAEVLEHIDNPVSFLKEIAIHYKDSIRNLIVTVPNAFGFIHMLQAMNNGVESINKDHRYWFTPYTLCKVAHQAGLVLDDLIMCIYEGSADMAIQFHDQLLIKPILLDTIVLVAHW